jgi:hypothetical protein
VSANPWLQTDAGQGIRATVSNGLPSLVLFATSQPVSLSAAVDTGTARPLQIAMTVLWLSTTGSLDLSLSGVPILQASPPQVLSSSSTQIQAQVADPALLNRGLQSLVVQLNPGSPGQVQILELSVTTVPEELHISQSQSQTGQIVLSWFGTTNTTYQLQAENSLAGGWTNLGAAFLGQNQVLSVLEDIDPAARWRFYRLHLLSSP